MTGLNLSEKVESGAFPQMNITDHQVDAGVGMQGLQGAGIGGGGGDAVALFTQKGGEYGENAWLIVDDKNIPRHVNNLHIRSGKIERRHA